MSPAAWEGTQQALVGDFIDLFLPPVYEFAVEPDYPRSPAGGRLAQRWGERIEFPKAKLLQLEKYWDEPSAETFESRLADWPVILGFEVLQGFGHGSAGNLSSAAFTGLKQLADIWGVHLAKEFQRIFNTFEFFSDALDLAADCILVIRQVPAKDLGEMIRGAATPPYIRAAHEPVP